MRTPPRLCRHTVFVVYGVWQIFLPTEAWSVHPGHCMNEHSMRAVHALCVQATKPKLATKPAPKAAKLRANPLKHAAKPAAQVAAKLVAKSPHKSPQGKIFLATIDIVAPISSTPSYSRPPRWIRTLNTRSVGPPERPCQNSAGQVTSNPFFWSLRTMRMKRERLRALDWSPSSLARLVPCSCWPCPLGTGRRSRVGLPTRGIRVPPWRRIGVPSGRVRIVVLVRLAVAASSSTFAFATLAFAIALVGVALATALATRVLDLKLRR